MSELVAHTNYLFPVFLKLENLQVLLVGGGNVALEKLNALLSNAPLANVTIVAPQIKQEIVDLINTYPNCKIVKENFSVMFLNNTDIVICTTDNKDLHKEIKQLSRERKLLVNVADTPELCDFYLGAIVQKGDLKIAISTNGKSPTIAKRIKEVLQETIPGEIDSLLHNMQGIRNKIGGDFSEKVKQLNELTKKLSQNQE